MVATSATPEVRLYGAEGARSGAALRVRGPAFLIGRAPDCELRTDGPQVSRHHAAIVFEGDRALLRDLYSRNGTLLNGRPVDGPTPLSDGDRIQVGSLVLLVSIWTPGDGAVPGGPGEGCVAGLPGLAPGKDAGLEGLLHAMPAPVAGPHVGSVL